ncbi:MAG TPA: hypothetical protein DDZ88_17930 [Verrucomicrobiales bacterium]|nr:hypothetical protein [Verrucomicrobiales bacterium]
MNTDPSTPENDANLSGLGRALLETGGSKPSSGPWVPPTAEELGKLLTEYDIVKMLGRGGMGAVYMGRQKSLDRPVAIKILSNTLDEADASFAERFKNEARAMGKLNHPGIVAVHDFGETDGGLLYIVMEYVEGTDVARMIAKEGRLHTEHAMAITAHVCDALAYAHDRGIIHRDIKPANIMVGYDGVVKVADFGLAKMTHSNATGLTQSGMAMGTLHYMAPEALMLGSAVDHRADIYAVGVMLYQMLTGKIPQGMFKLPSLQIPGLDPRYDAIITKAIMEDREARYQKVGEMRRDLDGILTQPVAKVEAEVSQAPAALPTQARPQRPGGQPYRPPQSVVHHKPAANSSSVWLVWVVLGVLALGGAYFVLNPASQKNRPSPDQTAPTQAVASTTTPASATKDAPFLNTLGMKFVPVPGTQILMCIHETRRQDYAAYATTTPGVRDEWTNRQKDGIPFGHEDTHPVVVNWEDAVAFCAWLSKKEGRTYRLPTDEEWSIAVGLGSKEIRNKDITPEMLSEKVTTEYPWGRDYPPKTEDQAGNYADSAWHEKFPTEKFIEGYTDGFPTTAPVMSFKPNKLGLYDMGGNMGEWVEDWWNAAQEGRVVRGASFTGAGHLLSSARHHPGPTDYRGVGFRCVVESATAPAVTVSSSPAPPDAMKPQVPASTATVATKDAPFVNTLGMKFVPVPITGGPTNGQRVLFSVWEARVQDYEVFAAETKCEWPKPPFEQGPTHPALNLSWDDARAFCMWLTEREHKAGTLGKNETYRLPSDHEWSCAVGIGDKEDPAKLPASKLGQLKDDFPWGSAWPPPSGVDNVAGEELQAALAAEKYSWHPFLTQVITGYRDDYLETAPVGSFPANQFGLHDLGGNAWEWCEDWFDERMESRTQRGGCWSDFDRRLLLTSKRAPNVPSYRGRHIRGVRCVLAASTANSAAINPAPASSSMPTPVAVPSTTDLQQFPDLRTRVANYQKARHSQLAALTTQYRSALTAEKDAATKTGVLAAMTAADFAIANAASFAQVIEQNLNATEVKPLPALAAVADPAPPRLKELRDIFVREVTKIESTLVASLDQSLATVQATLVQADKLGEAKAVEAYRQQVMAAFKISQTAPASTVAGSSSATASSLLQATKDKPFVNSLGMKFVPVPGTKTLFCIHETRMRDFEAFAKENATSTETWKNLTARGVAVSPTGDHPVLDMSWQDGQDFCAWLGKKEGITYRLPTDREWSYAVGIGERESQQPDTSTTALDGSITDLYPWGATWPPPKKSGNYADSLWATVFPGMNFIADYKDDHAAAAPVMSYDANELGIYDLGGNAEEWMQDKYDRSQTWRTVRGAGWRHYKPEVMLLSKRHFGNVRRSIDFGFRIVLELP